MLSRNMNINKKIMVTFAPILVALGVMSSVVGMNISNIQTANGWDAHTTTVLAVVEEALSSFKDQISSVRAYTILAEDKHKETYGTANAHFNKALDELAQLTSDNPAQQKRIATLRSDGQDYKNSIGDRQIALASDPLTHSQAVDIVRTGAATQKTAVIEAVLGEMSKAESDLLVVRRAAAQTAFSTAYLVLAVGAATAIALAVFMGWLLSRAVARPITALTDAMGRLANGDLTVSVPELERGDELGAMAKTVQVFKDAASEKLRLETEAKAAGLAQATQRERQSAVDNAKSEDLKSFVLAVEAGFDELSAGNLTVRMNQAVAPEFEPIRAKFNDSVSTLEETLGAVVDAVGSMRVGLNEITVAAGDLSQRTEQQAASLEETVAALSEVMRAVQNTAAEAGTAKTSASAALGNAEKGGGIVSQAVEAMSQIEQSSESIGKIIGVIDEIAFQTNLLALNAGVEAARAGEAGRGFAVVAQEVRGLAQRSAEAAKEIKSLISTSSTQVERGVSLVTASGRALEEIVSTVGDVSNTVTGIAGSAREQANSLKEVATAADQMDKVTQQNAAMVEETTAAAQSLLGETEQLASLVERFRTGGAPASSARQAPRSKAAPARRPAAPVAQMRQTGSGGAVARTTAQADVWEDF